MLVDEVAVRYASALCSRQVRCGLAAGLDSCVEADYTPLAAMHLDAVGVAAIHTGRARYDAGAMQQCLDALASRSCARRPFVVPTVCYSVVAGTLEIGGACIDDAECTSFACDAHNVLGSCVVGICVGDTPPHIPGLGEACTSICVDDTWCSPTGCAAFEPVNTACTTDGECREGLICAHVCVPAATTGQQCSVFGCRDEGTTCTDAGCTPRGFAGATCRNDMECAPQFVCDPSHQCVAVPAGPARRADGAACAGPEDCLSMFCNSAHACGPVDCY